MEANPLVVDLDGTLLNTDLLLESANALVARHPIMVPILAWWMFKGGRVGFKRHLAESVALDVASLPYNLAVLEWLRAQKGQGRSLVLATASHKLLAQAVARELGIFEEVLASSGEVNLKAEAKRDLLIQKFGEDGYDYMGNASADIPVLRAARRAYLVSSSPSMIAKVRAAGNLELVFETGNPGWVKACGKAMRLHQWTKNLLLLVPLLAAHHYQDVPSMSLALVAFLVFGLTASSVYVVNDLVDISADRRHGQKRKRPFAAGQLSLAIGWLLWPAMLVFAFGCAWRWLPTAFLEVLALYLATTMAYSFFLKRIAIVDVITLASLYTLRIIAGAAATGIAPSFWLLTFSMFLFLSLAFVKRYNELKSARQSDFQGMLFGRGYAASDLEIVSSMGVAAGNIAVLVLAFYIQDPHTAQLYRSPQVIWFACPLLLLWVSKTWLLAHRGQMLEDPIVFALKDSVSWLIAACLILDFIVARVKP